MALLVSFFGEFVSKPAGGGGGAAVGGGGDQMSSSLKLFAETGCQASMAQDFTAISSVFGAAEGCRIHLVICET